MFYKFNFPCDVPQLSWWSSFQFPKFNSVDVIGIELRAVDSIITKNARGQTVNTARSVGTDKEKHTWGTVSPIAGKKGESGTIQDYKRYGARRMASFLNNLDIEEIRSSETASTTSKTREYKKSYEDDPEYQEFLEFKRMRDKKRTIEIKQEQKQELSDQNEQFNELLLYVFTGFFLLMIYDNIYKLGKDSFY